MNTIPFPKNLIHNTPATIRMAFDSAAPLITCEGNMGSINISDILTRVIQDAGRFCEHYASDILYGLDRIRTLCDNKYDLEETIDEIFSFGLRECGSDHNAYILNQLANSRAGGPYVYAMPYYRRVLAVRVHVYVDPQWSTPRCVCELRDISHKFLHLNKADIDDNGQVNPGPYPDGNPVPIDPYAKNN